MGILAVLITVIFLTIGYAQFTTQLGIYGISPITNVLDNKIIRLVARYERLVGSGDEIEKINKGDS